MRGLLPVTILFTCACAAMAQQAPFIPVTGPNAPKGASFLFEDSRGGMWLGGNEGARELRYFDGTRFVNPVQGNFPDVLINGMAEDTEGGIWLTSTGGLFRLFRGQMEKVLDGSAGPGIARIAPDVFLTDFSRLAGNSTKESTLMRVSRNGSGWKTEAMMRVPAWVRFRADNFGKVLFPCEGGFCEFRIEDATRWRPGTTLPVKRHPTSVRATAVTRDNLGCVWTLGSNATYQCPSDPVPVVLPDQIVSEGNRGMSELADGSMVFATFGRLAIGRPGDFRVLTMANGYPSAGSQLVSGDGSIWISNANGVFVFSPHVRVEFWTQRDGLDGNTWSVLPFNGKVYAISADSIDVLEENRSRWRPLLAFRGATQLLAGPDNTILVSSRTDGVIQISADGRILRSSDPTNVMKLARSDDGQVWSAGTDISRVEISGNRLVLRSEMALSPQGVAYDIGTDHSGGVWTCDIAGLRHKEANGWRLAAGARWFGNSSCESFAIDGNGEVWAGTVYESKSLVADPMAGHARVQSVKIEYPAESVNFFGIDQTGRLWRGNSEGAFIADPEQAKRGQWLQLDRADGLPGNDTNQHSFTTDKDGSVWFGIDSSVIHIFPPADLVHPTYAPSVFVSGFSWDNGAFQMASMVDGIPHGANIAAHIGSLQMDRRSALRFRYRLLPEQTSWSQQASVDIAVGKLTWGKHTLEVQARLLDGPWSSTASKSFNVLKPVWLSTPAVLGFAFAGSVAAFGGLRWRRRRKQRSDLALPGIDDWRAAVLSPELKSLEGAVLDDRFEIRGIVARGGFATVWEGRDREQNGRMCAVKIFRHELLDKTWMAKRFQHEVSALTQIQHPNVVRIYGHGTVLSGAPYLVMEFIRGETLRDLLNETKLSRPQIAGYVRQIASALAEIHAHGVCHRDLKPENLMIRTGAAAGQELVLIDFSIAIVQDPDETIHGLSRAAGTIHYMAPEQAIGYANESSDIYSLAKIVIEMLTGQRLSVLLPDASIDLPDRVRELPLKLSESSIDLLARALEFDPTKRPKHADEFGEMIAGDLERELW